MKSPINTYFIWFIVVVICLLIYPSLLIAKGNLTWDEAKSRAQRVSAVNYTLAFTFLDDQPSYEGEAIINFLLSDDSTALNLDFQGNKIIEMEVNDHRIMNPKMTDGRILLLPKHLSGGRNQVRIHYLNAFNNDGAGLHKIVDTDGREYLFTHFEPYRANRVFPCFDQPDLKASFALSVIAPRSWTVISNAPEEHSRRTGKLTRHSFKKTSRFSTYLFALAAGPFAVWNDKEARIPSRIFSTQSMARYMDASRIFNITRSGFDFFENYFDFPYPFEKYDQIFVPQFNAGAMENVAAVIFNDRFIYRHQPTESQLMRRANIVLHELAHMWFGNIVTMQWWNDLWLNESFATYMAYLALSEATDFKDAWDGFARAKGWAYWQDQLPTTHPIETEVPDTRNTYSNFDGITYAKGAAVLKQLVFYVGNDAFQQGVSNYLNAHSWKNATRADFVEAIAQASGKDLQKWTEQWLRSSGVNSIKPRYKLNSDARIDVFNLDQGKGNGDALLRPHRLMIALFNKQDEKVVVRKQVSVEINGATQNVKTLVGEAVPDFVYANFEDHAYAKIYLDPQSISFAKNHLELLPTKIRTGVWQAIRYMIRDHQLSPIEYLDLFMAKAVKEQNPKLVDAYRYHLDAALNFYLPESIRATYMSNVQALVWNTLQQAQTGSDLQKTWFGYLLTTARTEKEQSRLARLLGEKNVIPGLEIDQEKRWSIVTRLAALGYANAHSLLEEEKLRDTSERGNKSAYKARVSLPDENFKQSAWKQFIDGEGLPLSHMRAGMSSFFQREQLTLTQPYIEAYFNALPKLAETKEHHYVRAFARSLFPKSHVDHDVLKQSEALLRKNALPYYVKRTLLEANDGLRRALRIRKSYFGDNN